MMLTQGMTVKKSLTKAELRDQKLLRMVRREVRAAAKQAIEARPYQWGYSVLTIVFDEGSDPQALSVPYQPWENQTRINLRGIRAMKVVPE